MTLVFIGFLLARFSAEDSESELNLRTRKYLEPSASLKSRTLLQPQAILVLVLREA